MTCRTLAIGDIHGCDRALDVLLEHVAPRADDTVIVVGDMIDRGPDSRQVVERLIGLAPSCRLITILGNHEEMLLSVLDGAESLGFWKEVGGYETLKSYGGAVVNIPDEHIEFFRAALPYYETEDDVFIHANLEPGKPLAQQSAAWLRWMHLRGWEPPHRCGKRVICGHTPQTTGRPLVFPGWVCIDTFSFGPGYLTCLEVGPDTVHQANQAGEFRSFPLDDE